MKLKEGSDKKPSYHYTTATIPQSTIAAISFMVEKQSIGDEKMDTYQTLKCLVFTAALYMCLIG